MGGGSGGGGVGGGGANACAGVSCTTPPNPVCKDAGTLTTYGNTGTCNNGQCSYTASDTVCMNGCSNNMCQNQNLCAGNLCLAPPVPTCMGMMVRTFMAPGVCNPGTGVCAYNPIDTTCPNGCAAGMCISPAQTFTQTMPRVKFAVTSVDQAPGSAGTHVLVVGAGGNILKWDGASFTKVSSTAAVTSDFNNVWFAGPNTAFAVGSSRTVVRYNGTSYAPVSSIPGSGSTAFTAIHGKDESAYTLLDGTENYWRFDSSVVPNWKTGSVNSGVVNGYKNLALYVDSSNRARIGGQRTVISSAISNGVVHYFSTACPTGCEDLDSTSSEAFGAVGGPAIDGGSVLPDSAYLGRATSTGTRQHTTTGAFSGTPFTLPAGAGIAAITPGSATRQVYFLTRVNAANVGHLYRYSGAAGVLDTDPLGDFYFNQVSMSRTESGGVIVAEASTTNQVNNIYRRSSVSSEMLDLGEGWSAVSSNGGTLVVGSDQGDLAARPPASATWQFRRGPFVSITDIAAGNGTGVLVAGKGGKLERFIFGAVAPTITSIASATTSDFNGICRVSDVEAYAVGASGAIRSINTTLGTAAAMSSTTVKNLLTVDCLGPGSAIACGQGGTVLRLSAGTWAPLATAFPNVAVDLTSCKVVGNVLWAAGDNAFYKIDLGATNPAWQQLAPQSRLSRLNVISATDVYAISANSRVVRFDGGAWNTLFTLSSGTLVGGGQVGGKVVYAGSLGTVVEGQ